MPEIAFDPEVYYRYLTALVLLFNGVGFSMFWLDKTYARKQVSRIPEWRLLMFGILGPIGALISMFVFRHKIRKPKFFTVLIPATVLHLYLIKVLIYWVQ